MALALALALAGCGELGSVEFAPGQFRVHGYGAYDDEADVQREAARVCPHGFVKLDEFEGPGTADVHGDLLLDIKCNENPK